MATLAHSESVDQDASAVVNDGEVALRPKSRHTLQIDKLPVQHVTVYLDKAEVSRKAANITMSAGINEVRFARLPAAIDKDTLRIDVKNTQNAQIVTSINDVSYISRFLPDEESDFHRAVKELQDSIDGLMQQRETLVAKLSRLEKQRAVLDSFADCFVQKDKQTEAGNAEKQGETNDKTDKAPEKSERGAKSDKRDKEKADAKNLSTQSSISSTQAQQNAANWAFEAFCSQTLNGNGMPLGIAAGAFGAAKMIECMSGFFDLFERQATQLDIGLQQTRRQLEKIDAEVRTHQTKMKELSFSRDEHQEREVMVVVETSEATVVDLNVAYVVSRAKWTPRYDVRVYTADSLIKVFYYGVVQQSTGEDWVDASLSLSTAQPAVGGAVPELLIHKIGFKSKISDRASAASQSKDKDGEQTASGTSRRNERQKTTQSGRATVSTTASSTPSSNAGTMRLSKQSTINGPSSSTAAAHVNGDSQPYRWSAELRGANASSACAASASYYEGITSINAIGMSQSAYLLPSRWPPNAGAFDDDELTGVASTPAVTFQVNAGGRELNRDQTASMPMSSTFEVSRNYTVACNATTIKVMIALIDLPATLEYEANPRRSPFAFLRATATNTSQYALIAGATNVYLNNQFVARSDLRTVLPQESFVAHLGADPGVRIVYRPLFKSRESGVIAKTSTVTHKQVIEVRNTYEKSIRILIADQVPLSNEEKIKVNILEPTIKHPEKYDRSKPIRLHPRTNIVEWDLEVPAKEAKELVLKYAIEYPTNEEVDYTTEA